MEPLGREPLLAKGLDATRFRQQGRTPTEDVSSLNQHCA